MLTNLLMILTSVRNSFRIMEMRLFNPLNSSYRFKNSNLFQFQSHNNRFNSRTCNSKLYAKTLSFWKFLSSKSKRRIIRFLWLI